MHTCYTNHSTVDEWNNVTTQFWSNVHQLFRERNDKRAKIQYKALKRVCETKKYLFTESHDLINFFFILKELP